jgi:hypothetical protein
MDFAKAIGLGLRAARNLNYYFAGLERDGYLHRVGGVRVRGAVQHFYRAKRRALISDAEFAQMSMPDRQITSNAVIEDAHTCAIEAVEAGTMDKRENSVLLWEPYRLDQQGFDETMEVLNRTYERAKEICAESNVRLKKSGKEGIPTVIALAGFEGVRTADQN